jgi:hypothetical protein
MPDNIQRSKGTPSNYKLNRGGVPAEGGPFIGTVMSNVDPSRTGRLRVYIEAFADGNMDDDTKWTTVSYLPPFYGSTPTVPGGDSKDVGNYPGNPNSYGMWFTPPDIGVRVICMFVNGQRDQGYYIGVVPEQGTGYMVPALGASTNFKTTNANQKSYFANATQLPVTEINLNNLQAINNPKYFDSQKPVQSYVAGAMFQQGLITDPERGPVKSSSQRETPSAVFGISTPGTAIYQGGMKPNDIRKKINNGEIKPSQAQVIGRVGGHSLLMDDGDLDGNNAMLRLRTSKGHQITMSDSGNFFYLIHANGQTWIEFGVEGTVDVYATNSVNVRTKGDINLHADRDINMYAGRDVSIKAKENMYMQAEIDLNVMCQNSLKVYSKGTVGIKSDGTLGLQSSSGSWAGGGSLTFSGGSIDLNGPSAASVDAPNPITKTILDDTKFNNSTGWEVDPGALDSIVSRAPTHEPYPYHNKGVDVKVAFEEGEPSPPPGAEPVPPGVQIEAL